MMSAFFSFLFRNLLFSAFPVYLAFGGTIVYGDFKMDNSHFGSGTQISPLWSAAFRGLTVLGTFSLQNCTGLFAEDPDSINGISQANVPFYGLRIRSNLFTLAGTKLGYLGALAFYGIELVGHEPVIDLSNCGIIGLVVEKGGCYNIKYSDETNLLQSASTPSSFMPDCGPFTGIIYPGKIRTIDLSHNDLTMIPKGGLSA